MSNGREANGYFAKGNKIGVGGGPKSGRARAFRVLDEICGNEENLESLRAAMQAEFDIDPMGFFRSIIMPLAPKEVAMTIDDSGFATLTPSEACAEMDKLTIGDISHS